MSFLLGEPVSTPVFGKISLGFNKKHLHGALVTEFFWDGAENQSWKSKLILTSVCRAPEQSCSSRRSRDVSVPTAGALPLGWDLQAVGSIHHVQTSLRPQAWWLQLRAASIVRSPSWHRCEDFNKHTRPSADLLSEYTFRGDYRRASPPPPLSQTDLLLSSLLWFLKLK